jgi:hypothetical protein
MSEPFLDGTFEVLSFLDPPPPQTNSLGDLAEIGVLKVGVGVEQTLDSEPTKDNWGSNLSILELLPERFTARPSQDWRRCHISRWCSISTFTQTSHWNWAHAGLAIAPTGRPLEYSLSTVACVRIDWVYRSAVSCGSAG